MTQRLRVLASPGLADRFANPYTWHLYSNIKHSRVHDFTYTNVVARAYDVVHFHWPEEPLNYEASALTTSMRLARQFAAIDFLRLRGARIIWTVHNLRAHDGRFPALESRFWQAFTKKLDGYIALSTSGREAALQNFPSLRTIPGFIVPHGDYRDSYHVSSAKDRAWLGIDREAVVMLSLGWLRPYKNVPRLIKEFKALAGANKVLIVAGRPSTADLRREIELEAREDPRIRLDLAYLSEEKVATYLQAADLVVLPYKEILNSGTALLSLSLNRPLLVPKLGALHELAAEVGVEWVRLYEGELTTGELDRAVQWAQRTVRPPAAPLENRAWPLIASHTLEVYKEVIGSLPAKHPAAQSSKAGAAGSLFNECGATRYHGSVNPQSDACGGRTNAK